MLSIRWTHLLLSYRPFANLWFIFHIAFHFNLIKFIHFSAPIAVSSFSFAHYAVNHTLISKFIFLKQMESILNYILVIELQIKFTKILTKYENLIQKSDVDLVLTQFWIDWMIITDCNICLFGNDNQLEFKLNSQRIHSSPYGPW